MSTHLDSLAACCSPLSDHWPFAAPLAGAYLLSSHVDSSAWQPDDFSRCAIEPVPGVAKRQSEYLAGRLCAREAVRRLTGLAQAPAIGADRAPQWPAQLCGSISHGQGLAAALVAHQKNWRGLGFDIEQPLSPRRAERLAPQLLTPGELQRLAGQCAEQRAWQISLTFSLKESLFKALYPLTLRRFYFQDAELLDNALGQAGPARLRLLTDLNKDWPAGSSLDGQFCRFGDHLLSLVAVPT